MKTPMLQKKHLSLFAALSLVCMSQLHAQQAAPGTSANTNKITIDLVPVGDPNNHGDIYQNGMTFGSVPTEYQIGKYDVTVEQYCAFLNAVASHSDPHLLYDERMSTDPHVASLTRSGDETTGYVYQPISDYCKKFPITYVSWFSTLRFCNWLENGQPVGDEIVGITESGAYNRDAQGVWSLGTNSKWNLPTENQWYKAAYYQPAKNGSPAFYYSFGNSSYYVPDNNETADLPHQEANYCLNGVFTTATQPRLTPVGTFINSASPCGAYDMTGNVNQWTSTPIAIDLSTLVVRGGSWASTDSCDLRFSYAFFFNANTKSCTLGFRVVYNEPAKKKPSSWWWPFGSWSESL